MKKSLSLIGILIISMIILSGCRTSSNQEDSTNENLTNVENNEEEKSNDDEIVEVGVSAQYVDILEYASEDFENLTDRKLEVVAFNDFVQPNTALYERSIDANVYQFASFLTAHNESNPESDLVLYSDHGVYATPYGIYSESIDSLDDLESGAIVGIGNDASNRGLALLLLEEQGLISLIEDHSGLPDLLDIDGNPRNLQLEEIGSTNEVVSTLPDLDIGVTSGVTMHLAGKDASSALAVGSDKLTEETALHIVVNEDRQNEEWIEALYESLTNDRMKNYLEENYAGALIVPK